MPVVVADRRRRDVRPEMAGLVDDDVVVEHDAVLADHGLEPAVHERIEHEEGVAASPEIGSHRRHLRRQQRHFRPRHDQHRAAGEPVAPLHQRDLLHLVVQVLETVTGLGHPVALVQHVLGPQAVGMTGRPLQVVMGFHAEGVRLAVAVEEAHGLRRGARHTQDAVGDIRLAVAVHLELTALALHDGRSGELHTEHPGLGGVEHGIVELDADEPSLLGDQLIELDRLAHHRIVEEDDVDRLLQPPQHGHRGRRQRVQPRLGQIEPDGIERRQIGQRDQHADQTQGVERDFAPAPPNHRPELGPQGDGAPGRQQRSGAGEQRGPHHGLQEDRLNRERQREQGDAQQENESRAERTVHLSAATGGNWH